MSGIQGYSTRTPKHVLFSVPTEYAQQLIDVCRDKHYELGHLRGMWQGKEEHSYSLPRNDFNALTKSFGTRQMFYQEQAYILLGTPTSQNWRPATLCYYDTVDTQDLGMFIEVSAAEAKASDGWTHDPKRNCWWVCKKNAPRDEYSRQDQLILDALRYAAGEVMNIATLRAKANAALKCGRWPDEK